jgi:hypothetical protein
MATGSARSSVSTFTPSRRTVISIDSVPPPQASTVNSSIGPGCPLGSPHGLHISASRRALTFSRQRGVELPGMTGAHLPPGPRHPSYAIPADHGGRGSFPRDARRGPRHVRLPARDLSDRRRVGQTQVRAVVGANPGQGDPAASARRGAHRLKASNTTIGPAPARRQIPRSSGWRSENRKSSRMPGT